MKAAQAAKGKNYRTNSANCNQCNDIVIFRWGYYAGFCVPLWALWCTLLFPTNQSGDGCRIWWPCPGGAWAPPTATAVFVGPCSLDLRAALWAILRVRFAKNTMLNPIAARTTGSDIIP